MGKLGYLTGEALKSLLRVMEVAGSTPDAVAGYCSFALVLCFCFPPLPRHTTGWRELYFGFGESAVTARQ